MGYLEQWTMDGRTCTKCGTDKQWSEFGRRPTGKNGRQSMCLSCYAVAHRRYREANRDHVLAVERARDRRTNRHLKRTYGIDRPQLDLMILSQEGRCGICPAPLRKVFVDHDHGTGRVRSLLCPSCNNMLGLSGDSPARLRAAADYIERHRGEVG